MSAAAAPSTPVTLSVVIPAWNEALRLPATLTRVVAFLRARNEAFEVVVVDDGSTDGTAAVARAHGDPAIRVAGYGDNRGKGHAVRTGMLAASGALRLMTDADLSTPIEDLRLLEEAMGRGFHVAIGSRALRTSNVEVRQGAFREGMGRLFNLVVRLLLLRDLRDTQCGFKLFTAEAAQAAFSATRLDGFSFDVEALVAARRRGYRIAEVGVTWRNDVATRVGFSRGGRAFADLIHIAWNVARGVYDSRADHSRGGVFSE
jgi:dolichyl-phosphate beta-glucosyltransferase